MLKKFKKQKANKPTQKTHPKTRATGKVYSELLALLAITITIYCYLSGPWAATNMVSSEKPTSDITQTQDPFSIDLTSPEEASLDSDFTLKTSIVLAGGAETAPFPERERSGPR